jgi:UDP-3-O-[3-hydroxymyristoyl] glucosamine N-acyltransferase
MTGSPVMPHKLWLRVQRILPMLPELKKKIAELEKKTEQLK